MIVPGRGAEGWENELVGVSDSPITPRTPEMLIFRVGIARTFYQSLLIINSVDLAPNQAGGGLLRLHQPRRSRESKTRCSRPAHESILPAALP